MRIRIAAPPDEEANPDWPASGVLLGFAVLTVLVAASWLIGAARPPFAGAMALMLAGLAYRYAPVAPAAAGAVLVTLGTMLFWPLAREAGAEPRNLFPDVFGASPRPEAVETYLGFAAGLTAVIAAACLWRIARGRTLPLATAAWYIGAATVGPLLVLVVAYWRVTGFDRSISFAVVAALLAAAFAGAAGWLRRIEGPDAAPIDGVRLALGATASAAIAALAAGLTFALDKGMLTVAFALAALGTAWVADRTALPILRYVVGAIGIVVLARLAYDPTIAGEKLGTTPIFNWLLWGYGVPALSFFLASRLLEKSGRDRVVRFVESLSIAFAAFLVFFEIRHWLQGGDPFAATSDHLELGLMATAGLAFAIVMVRAQARRPDVVYDVASRLFGALTCVVCIAGLGVVANPLWSDEEVIGGAIFNSLMLAYLLPAILAAALAYFSWGVRPQWYVPDGRRGRAGAAALSIRCSRSAASSRDPKSTHGAETSQGELWTYSIALLVIGVAILAVGFLRDSRPLRLLSAGYIIAAILKVFLIDLASLQGVTRALSFIGLGLALVGIGLTYQKLLARRAGPIPAPPGP